MSNLAKRVLVAAVAIPLALGIVWYGGLAGTPVWVTPGAVADPQAALIIARNGALGAVTALLLGLAGSAVGGWMASGEPMTISYYRTRAALAGGSK